jgi:PhoH-like ATPase
MSFKNSISFLNINWILMQDIQRTSGVVAKTTKQDDSTIIRSGVHHLPVDFWDHNERGEDNGEDVTVKGSIAQAVMVNEFLVSGQDMNHIPKTSRVVKIVDGVVILKKVDDYLNRQAPRIYGIKPKNSEQNLALNLLMDREIDLPDLSAPFFKKNISA